MKKVSLQFKDILQLLEFIEYTKNHHCHIDIDNARIACELSEAEIELAINGFDAVLLEE